MLKKNLKFVWNSIDKIVVLLTISGIFGIALKNILGVSEKDIPLAAITGATMAGFWVSIWIYRKGVFKDGFKRVSGSDWKNIVISYIIYIVVLVGSAMILKPEAAQQNVVILAENKIMFIVFPVFVAPVQEEIFFRYEMLKDEEADDWVKILTTAILFGLIHFQVSTDVKSDIRIIFVTAVLGGLSANIFRKTKYENITPSIVFHALVNLLPTVLWLLADI